MFLLGVSEFHVLVDGKLGRCARPVVTGTGGTHAKAAGISLNLVRIGGTLPRHGDVVARYQFVERSIFSFRGEVPPLGTCDTDKVAPHGGDVNRGLWVVRSGSSRSVRRLPGIDVDTNRGDKNDADKAEKAAHGSLPRQLHCETRLLTSIRGTMT